MLELCGGGRYGTESDIAYTRRESNSRFQLYLNSAIKSAKRFSLGMEIVNLTLSASRLRRRYKLVLVS